MANVFREMKRAIGVLNAERNFCRDETKLELIDAKVTALEEVFDFAKEYVSAANHQSGSDVGDRLYYYLTEGRLCFKKVADHFKVSPATVASNVHYASKAFSSLTGDLVKRMTEAEDLETVQAALQELRKVKKSVMNPYDIPEIPLKKIQKRDTRSIPFIKSTPYIVIPK